MHTDYGVWSVEIPGIRKHCSCRNAWHHISFRKSNRIGIGISRRSCDCIRHLLFLRLFRIGDSSLPAMRLLVVIGILPLLGLARLNSFLFRDILENISCKSRNRIRNRCLCRGYSVWKLIAHAFLSFRWKSFMILMLLILNLSDRSLREAQDGISLLYYLVEIGMDLVLNVGYIPREKLLAW